MEYHQNRNPEYNVLDATAEVIKCPVAKQRIAIISEAGVMSKPDSSVMPLVLGPKSGDNTAQGTVVYIEYTPPDDFFQSEAVRLMLVQIIVE